MTFNNSAGTAGTYLSHWVNTATAGQVFYVGKKNGIGEGTGTLGFICNRCNASLYVDEASFGFGGDLIPTTLQQWVNQHRHRTNDNIREKIENYIAAALKMSSVIKVYNAMTLEHVFSCHKCDDSKFEIRIHEDEFVESGQRLKIPPQLTGWMLEHTHEDSLVDLISKVKQIAFKPGKQVLKEDWSNWADTFEKMPVAEDMSGWGAYKSQYNNVISKPWIDETMIKPKPFLLPRAPAKMPKELPSNPVQDSDTLKTFEGRKFRK